MDENQKTTDQSQNRIRNFISLVMAVSAVVIYSLTIYGYTQTGRIDWINVIVAALSLLIAVKIRRQVKRNQAGGL